MREMIDHESSGLLVAPGDVAGLSAALLRLCDDEAFRRRLSDGVPDVCSLEEHIDQLRRLYRDALGGS
jgi:glycosyltransferase involved in cell wall biosynthesis